MKKRIWIVLISALPLCLFSQTTANFEDFVVPGEGFLNGNDGGGGFDAGHVFLPNEYDQAYFFWTGWAISNSSDVTTPGFTNQYSSISGGGNNSDNYAVSFSSGENIIELKEEAAGNPVQGMYVNNGTYAYLSMKDGDAFAKKFGGVDGTDPDFFLLTIKKYSDGILSQDSVDFYLADYRFAEASSDYIVNEWTYVDLTSLGSADSLSLSLSSSDNGQFGMNTPAYFCIDDLTTADGPSSLENFDEINTIELFPNPANDFISINKTMVGMDDYEIYDMSGKIVKYGKLTSNARVDIGSLNRGQYIFQFKGTRNNTKALFLKL